MLCYVLGNWEIIIMYYHLPAQVKKKKNYEATKSHREINLAFSWQFSPELKIQHLPSVVHCIVQYIPQRTAGSDDELSGLVQLQPRVNAFVSLSLVLLCLDQYSITRVISNFIKIQLLSYQPNQSHLIHFKLLNFEFNSSWFFLTYPFYNSQRQEMSF